VNKALYQFCITFVAANCTLQSWQQVHVGKQSTTGRGHAVVQCTRNVIALCLGFDLLAFGIHWNGFVFFLLFVLDIFMTDSNL
jgi:hypothetical protein